MIEYGLFLAYFTSNMAYFEVSIVTFKHLFCLFFLELVSEVLPGPDSARIPPNWPNFARQKA